MKIILSQEAENDIANIAIYTIEHWGMNQAVKYNDTIENAYHALGENPLTPLSK